MSVRMTKSAGWRGATALATLGAALAMALVPSAASAQDGGRGRWGGDNAQGENRTGRGNWEARSQAGDGGGHGGGWRARQAESAQGQPQVQVQQAPRQYQGGQSGQWQGNRGQWNGGGQATGGSGQWQGRQGWRQRQAEQAQQQAPTSPAQTQTWQGQRSYNGGRWQGGTPSAGDSRWSNGQRSNGQWSGERNRTYSDPYRNQSYRDGQRAENWRDHRGDSWRDGNRSERYRGGSHGYNQSSRDWNRGWRNDNRYNWYSYRNLNRNHYRLGRYYAPYDSWSYRRIGIGFFLDDLFYSNQYWIDDPWSYRLPDAYGPYRWIRYYDDALLVNIYTGEVVDAINDFFW